jgi:hypothetical protein
MIDKRSNKTSLTTDRILQFDLYGVHLLDSFASAKRTLEAQGFVYEDRYHGGFYSWPIDVQRRVKRRQTGRIDPLPFDFPYGTYRYQKEGGEIVEVSFSPYPRTAAGEGVVSKVVYTFSRQISSDLVYARVAEKFGAPNGKPQFSSIDNKLWCVLDTSAQPPGVCEDINLSPRLIWSPTVKQITLEGTSWIKIQTDKSIVEEVNRLAPIDRRPSF